MLECADFSGSCPPPPGSRSRGPRDRRRRLAGGVFSLAFAHRTGIAVGGDFEHPKRGKDASAYSRSLGRVWHNGGRTWTRFGRLDLDAVQCVAGACWGSGPDGVVARLVRP